MNVACISQQQAIHVIVAVWQVCPWHDTTGVRKTKSAVGHRCGTQRQSIHCITVKTSLRTSVCPTLPDPDRYEGWNFNSGNYLFTTGTK